MVGWIIRWLIFPFFHDIMVQKDPAPTHDATMLHKVAFPSASCLMQSFRTFLHASQTWMTYLTNHLTCTEDTTQDKSTCCHKLRQTVRIQLPHSTSLPKVITGPRRNDCISLLVQGAHPASSQACWPCWRKSLMQVQHINKTPTCCAFLKKLLNISLAPSKGSWRTVEAINRRN